MYCRNCGNKIEDGSTFCGNCGNPINNKKKKINISFFKKKIIIIPCIILLIFVLLFIMVFNIGKYNLSKSLIKDWSRIETGESGSIYELELDFSQDKIDYNFVSSYSFLNSTISTLEYKVISPSKIKVKYKTNNTYKTYKITFNDDKSKMTITPALTSTDDSEDWFYHD